MSPPKPTVKYLPYTIALKSPALLTGFAGDPNSASSLDFIPGSSIRGALASLVVAQGHHDVTEELTNLVLSGRVRYLNAYLEHQSTRALPTPATWRCKKGENNEKLVDLAAFTGDVTDETEFELDDDGISIEPNHIWPSETLDRRVPPFMAFSGSSTTGLAPEQSARVHQQRDRERGRSWTKVDNGREEPQGTVYAYEFLEGHQTFRGFLQIFEESESKALSVIARLRALLDQKSILIGRSRRGGYGGSARLHFEVPTQSEANWEARQNSDLAIGQTFRAYLLSDCILRDPFTGQVDPTALLDELLLRLGGEAVIEAESIRPFWDFTVVGGFNNKWRLSLPQASAVKSGSIIVLKTRASLSCGVLRQIEHEGLGERRIDGFGRVLFLRDGQTQGLSLSTSKHPEVPSYPPGPPPASLELFQKRVLDEGVLRSIETTISTLSVKTPPNRSLIGRLRHCLRHPCPKSGLTQLRRLLSDSEEGLKSEARKKIQECKIGKETLINWLEEGAGRHLDQLLGPELRRKWRLVPNPADPWLSKVLEHGRARYEVQLIDHLLARLVRTSRQQEGIPYAK